MDCGDSSRSEKHDGFLEILNYFKVLRTETAGEDATERSKKLSRLEKLFKENSYLILKFKSFTLKDQGDACVKLLRAMEEVLTIVKELKVENEKQVLARFDEFRSNVKLLHQWVQQQEPTINAA